MDTQAATDRAHRSERILLVMEHRPVLRKLANYLRSRGFRVKTAQTVDSASKQAAEAQPDMLLCDYRLSDGGAVELLTRLGDRRPVAAVVMLPPNLSRHGNTARECLDGGFDACLMKPFRAPLLMRLIDRDPVRSREWSQHVALNPARAANYNTTRVSLYRTRVHISDRPCHTFHYGYVWSFVPPTRELMASFHPLKALLEGKELPLNLTDALKLEVLVPGEATLIRYAEFMKWSTQNGIRLEADASDVAEMAAMGSMGLSFASNPDYRLGLPVHEEKLEAGRPATGRGASSPDRGRRSHAARPLLETASQEVMRAGS